MSSLPSSPTQQEDDRERSARIDEDLDDPRGADESLESSAAAPATTARSKPHHRAQAVSKQCATCGKQLRSARALRDHQNLHSGARPYGCGQCERRFPSKAALRQHAGVHSGKWACDLCDKVYSTEPALSTHRSYRHFPERLTSHVCPVCGKQFLGRKPYTKHMGTHAAERRQLPCSQPGCHSTFRSESALRVHEAKHAGRRFACDQCPALFFSNASLLQHMVGHGSVEARFACPQCPRRFMYRSVLRSHVRSVHALSRDCVCERCGATFATTYALNSHQATHTEGRPHVCQCCPAAFKSKQLLARHVRNVHLQQKQHPCPQCDKSFHTPYHLRVHLRCHTGERPFACPRCPKRFAQRAHVRSHLHVHRQGRADGSEQPHLGESFTVVIPHVGAPSVPVESS